MNNSGLLIHPEELDDVWVDELISRRIPVLGLHPTGGTRAADSFAAQIRRSREPRFRELVDRVTAAGISVEYEAHALRYLLPAEEFTRHPAWFRTDASGNRNPDFNCCVSNEEALDYIAGRAAEAVRSLYVGSSRSHRHYFWTDDKHDVYCHCPECSRLSPSEQQLMLMNAVVRRLRRDDPQAMLAFLSYNECVEPPRAAEPSEGIFLEIAPMNRDIHKPLYGSDDPRNSASAAEIRALVSYFGPEHTKILDYWLDNSWFSSWTKPPKRFVPDVPVMKADIDFYHSLGITDISVFACFLGSDYRELYGMPDLGGYELFIR